MPSAVVHGTIPLLLLLATRRLDARKIWILWPLTFFPDLDYFFGLHRAALSNVFILLPSLLGLWWSWFRPATRDPEKAQWWLISLVYLASHLVMDTFNGGTVLLYPLSDYTTCYYAEILIVTATNAPHVDIGACSREGIPTVAQVYPWLGVTDSAVLAFLLPAGLLIALWNLRAYRRERTANPEQRKRS